MVLRVAIASENDSFDGEVYRALLAKLSGREVQRWRSDISFNGYRSVAKFAEAFLTGAAKDGVVHAFFAIDNDGKDQKRPPEHEAHDSPPPFDINDDVTCRVCWLTQSLPRWWNVNGRRHCAVVPVQTIETWLLTLGAHAFEPPPEKACDRNALKRWFDGRPRPSLDTRTRRAIALLDAPGALDRLRLRRSFRHFEAQVDAFCGDGSITRSLSEPGGTRFDEVDKAEAPFSGVGELESLKVVPG